MPAASSALNTVGKLGRRRFGSFRTRQRGARTGRTPKTGAAVDVPAKRIAYFKPGKELKQLMQWLVNEPGTREPTWRK